MGGRGASSRIVHRAPNYDKVTITEPKITRFCLEPSQKNYKEFVDVGYSKDKPKQLKTDLLKGLSENETEITKPNSHGDISVTVYMKLGVTKKRTFRTGWQIDKGTNFPRFVTAYRFNKKR